MPQHMQIQLNELGLFFQDGNNIYHVICKTIPQDCLQGSGNFIPCDDEHDYEFFFRNSNAIFYVTCKLLSYPLIVNLLNKEIYGMDFDVKDLKCRYLLTLYEKLNLEENLKQILPLYLSQHHIPDNEMILNPDKISMNSFHENIEKNNILVDNQDGFESTLSHDDYMSHQNENGAET
ncbi:hypothetical protein RclHR1_02200011 [Rhizophagus clarus]|nr:hypothetical protein RclHR1_02200011 [Rhizophagus clarus]